MRFFIPCSVNFGVPLERSCIQLVSFSVPVKQQVDTIYGSPRGRASFGLPYSDPLLPSLSFSVLTAIFPGEPGLSDFVEAKMMEVVVTTGAISRA